MSTIDLGPSPIALPADEATGFRANTGAEQGEENVAGSDTAAAGGRSGRLIGIDIARGLALVGMFTQHVFIAGPDGESSTGWVEWVFRESAGRASVLFFVLSGVSLSLIYRKGSPSATNGALIRRGVLLLFGGILLTDAVWGGSILQHYGLAFLLAPLLLRSGLKRLLAVTTLGLVGGPIFLLYARNWSDDVRGIWEGRTGEWIIGETWELLADGSYPMALWIGFFTLGMLIGRLDLRSRRVLLQTLAVALVAVFAVGIGAGQLADRYGSPDGFGSDSFADDSFDDGTIEEMTEEEWKQFLADEDVSVTEDADGFMVIDGDFDDSFDDSPMPDHPADWKELYDVSGHSGRIGWTLQTSALAVAIMSAALLLPRFATTPLTPLAWMGSMSLTAYLIHIVMVNDVFDRFVADEGLPVIVQEWIVLGLIVTLIALCALFRVFLPAGPFEWVLKKFTVSR